MCKVYSFFTGCLEEMPPGRKIMEVAIYLTKNMPTKKQRVVAIITNKRGHIISVGMNSYTKTHPTQAFYAKSVKQPYKVYLHAEIDAIIKLKERPDSIYIARVRPDGEIGMAKPCNICKVAIDNAGIKKVIFTQGMH